VDPHSKQRYFQFGDIPSIVEPSSLTWEGDNLVVRWRHDIPGFDEAHVSTYHADSLHAHKFNGFRNKRVRLWTKKDMEKQQHWISYDRYLNDQTAFTQAMRALADYGLIFVKDVPDSREEVERIATRMGPLRNSFYGSTWDVRSVPKAKNVAYTNQNLGFHMDLLYMKDPPGYQLLHCLKNSCEGGESLFVDSFDVASSLKEEVSSTLRKWKVHYHYQHEDQAYHTSRPVLEFARYGSRVLEHVNYSPPFQAPFHARPDDPSWSPSFRKFHRAYRDFSNALGKEDQIFELKLNPGECVIFENRRVLHARRAFDMNSGERWLAGAYVDEDAVLSRFGVLERDHPSVWKGDFQPK
jgi:alpha-ketoglutarate-dependent taurine dioxygenase